jgi:hypothetical protein
LYWSHNEGFVWLLQNAPAVPKAIRDEASQWVFPKDAFIDNRHRPHHIYVRQGRRIWGEYTVTQNDAKPVFETGLPARHADGVAVAEFEFDSHAVRECIQEHYLANYHGTFYEVPRGATSPAGVRKLPDFQRTKPVATHNRSIADFCVWRGMLVLSGVKADAACHATAQLDYR